MSENVTKTKEQDGRKPGEDYRDADGILVCGKCGEPRERMFPAGGIFKEPHLVPTMCRCQREEADRQREETERAEKRRRTERLRKQCFPYTGSAVRARASMHPASRTPSSSAGSPVS